jgi:hypothetical protein
VATDLQPTQNSESTPSTPTGGTPGTDLESTDRERYRELLSLLAASARRAGRGAVVSGRWLTETVVDMAPRVPLRDVDTLSRHHDGLTGAELARSMIRSSGRVSGSIGAAAGGLIAVQELSVVGALAIPFEVAAETALVVLVEVKLVAELHRVAGRPFAGNARDQMAGALRSWLSGRGLSSPSVVVAPARLDLLGRATRRQLNQRLRQRFTRNLTTLGPLLTGAVAAGWLNRRATRAIGRRLLHDLDLT